MDSRLIKMASAAGIHFPTVLPLFRSPPKKEAIEKWVEWHKFNSKRHHIARKIADNINYISFEKFLLGLKETINDFNARVQGPYLLWIPQDSDRKKEGCSDLWTAGLAFEYCGLRRPEAIIRSDKLVDYLKEHPAIKDILVLDDASYSGKHIAEQIAFDFEDPVNTSVPGGVANFKLYVGIPFMTSRSESRLLGSETIFLLHHSQIKSIGEIFDNQNIEVSDGYRLTTFLTTTYFDHKFADFLSVLQVLWDGSFLVTRDDFMETQGYVPIERKHKIESNHELKLIKNWDEYFSLWKKLYFHAGSLIPKVIEPYKLESEDGCAGLKIAIEERSVLGERTEYPIPERCIKVIDILKSAGMEVKVAESVKIIQAESDVADIKPANNTAKNKLSEEEFKSAIKHYVAYKDKFFFRWLASSKTSYQATLKLREAKSDEDRFTIAEEYVNKNPNKQLAKSLHGCMGLGK